MTTERLFGHRDDEWLDGDLYAAAERLIDRSGDTSPGDVLVVWEWDTHPPDYAPMKAEHIVEWLIERAAEDGEVHEGWWDQVPKVNDEMVAAAEALRQAIAKQIKFTHAKDKLAEHRLVRQPDSEHGQQVWLIESTGDVMRFPSYTPA